MDPLLMRRVLHLFAIVLFLQGLISSSQAAPPRPNVLFLFADDQRADTIAALGNKVIKTPNLDRLARQGLAFHRAYMQGAMNGATCVPSRAMLLTGQSLFHIDEQMLRDKTWPAAFSQGGYTTFMAGKWHNGAHSIPLSFQQAPAIFLGGMTDPLQAQLSSLSDGKIANLAVLRKHTCEIFADEAIEFLKADHDRPFFCYVPFNAPHDPHVVPDEFPIRYDTKHLPLPSNFLPQHPWNIGEMTLRDELLLPWPRTPQDVRAMNADYYRYVSFLDAQIGRILDALEASPYANSTIIVFAADSGVARGSHGLIGKQNVYDHSVHVPLIIAGPGISAGQATSAMCYLFDVLPTLGKLCGIVGPETSEGIEFTATLHDPSSAARPHLMFAYKGFQRAIRDQRWKLIRFPLIDKTQLFDLENDPDEVNDLADKPEYAKKVDELLALLKEKQHEFGDVAPLRVDSPMPASWTPPGE